MPITFSSDNIIKKKALILEQLTDENCIQARVHHWQKGITSKIDNGFRLIEFRFGLVSLHINLRRLFNAKAILQEEQ